MTGPPVETSRPYLRPVSPAEFELRAGEVALVTLQPASFAEYLERSGERGSRPSRSTAAPHLTAWGLVMDHAATFLDDAESPSPAVEDELHDLLCWSLLHAFEDPWVETSRSGMNSSALRRALQYIDDHADGVVTVPDVAAAAKVSARSLHLLFRRELGTTPYRWLHDLRLDRARHDLLDGTGPVARVAVMHGLPHAGRFAAQYRARFGEYPLTTLRGTRSTDE